MSDLGPQPPDSEDDTPLPPELEVLNPEQKKQVLRFAAQYTSGPLPSPETLARYGDIDTSFPERIVRMAEREMSHRHGIQDKIVESQRTLLMGEDRQVTLITWALVAITAFTLVIALIGMLTGNQWVASIALVTAVVPVAINALKSLLQKSSNEGADSSRGSQG